LRVCEKTVASEGRSRSAGAQEPQCILKYMRIPSTAGTRDPERSRFFSQTLSATLAVTASGLFPNEGVHALLGPEPVATGSTNARGEAHLSFALPFGVRGGPHLVTVGNDGTAVTADCLVDVEVPTECSADTTPPVFEFVPPAVTVSNCRSPDIGQARASDLCGVKVTNDAPTVFPLGTTTVTWIARDPSGNTATARQLVTVRLRDDGTPGSDCIVGRGGDDILSLAATTIPSHDGFDAVNSSGDRP
ncbi:MAG: hypothetical protein ACREYF_11370, partial [Gammaproteobacteria bacterium]